MTSPTLDAVDHGILYHLQQDAHQPLTNIADAVGVADNTVRNSIEKLEQQGIIKRYTIDVDYGRAGVQHHYIFVCTARVGERERLIEEARTIPGIVRATSVMTGTANLILEATAPSKEDVTNIAYQLDDLGLLIEREHLIWEEFRQPYTGFRPEESR